MINFRYHVVSLIAVFLALAIGVIMGSAVIDRAIVNRLEDQQTSLEKRIKGVETENDALRGDNRTLKDTSDQLAEQGSQRLLAGALADVPVAVIATRGSESDSFGDLLSLLGTSGADRRGVIWLTGRFKLDGDDEVRDLSAALSAPNDLSVGALRRLALTRFAAMVREMAGPSAIEDPSVSTTTSTSSTTSTTTTVAPEAVPTPRLFLALRDAGFIDFDAPEGQPDDVGPQLVPGTRVILFSGGASDPPVAQIATPLAEQLVIDRPGVPSIALLAAEDLASEDSPTLDFVLALRKVDTVASRLSTVDNISDFAGRLAVVLALDDLGDGRVGQYGVGSGAQRLLPAPADGP